MAKPIISADSHITEAPGTYVDRIDRRFRDRAPHVVRDAKRGDLFVIDGMDKPIPMGLIAAAGKPAEELRMFGARMEDMHPGGFDPEARLGEQDVDGVSAEVLYPTVGMMLCNHPDFDYKHACFDAYNGWIAEYCAAHPDRLIGVGQTAMRSVEEGIEDLREMKRLGLRGVMMPGNPAVADYDDPIYAPFYEAAVDLGLPLSFHILTSQGTASRRGAPPQRLPLDHPRLPGHHRHVRPGRRLRAASEAQARVRGGRRGLGPALHVPDGPRLGAAPLLAAGGDAHEEAERVLPRARVHHVPGRLGGLPGDRSLQRAATHVGERLPHSDSTWPHSQDVLAAQTAHLSPADRDLILHDNVAELYGLER